MNKLLTPNGGMYLEGDDIRFMDDGIREALTGVFDLFTNDGNLIISGLEVTTDSVTITVSEGYVLIGGEVLFCPEHTFTEDGLLAAYEITLNVTYDSNGFEVFADSVSRDTYEIRRAKITRVGVSNNFVISDSKRLSQKINEIAFDNVIETNIPNALLQNSWTVGSQGVLKRIKQGRRIYLEGSISAGQTGSIAFNLPTGYRPSHALQFPVSFTTGDLFGWLQISTNGDVAILAENITQLSGGDNVYLDGITFLVS